jgi:NAD(P)H-flavin reductase
VNDSTMTIEVNAQKIDVLSGSIYRIVLQSESIEQAIPEFIAGQYLQLDHDSIEPAFFTIACAPEHGLELHIEVSKEGGSAEKIVELFQSGATFKATMAFGDTHAECFSGEKPKLLICSGSGFSQIKAIAEHLLTRSGQPVYIYWAARKSSGLYMMPLAENWAEQYDNVHFSAVISENLNWDGNHSQLDQVIIADHNDLSDYEIICCGSPAMVYHTLDTLAVANAKKDNFFSDVFAYAPRD